MQYHYVVMYDTEFDTWSIDMDPLMQSGHIFDPDAPFGKGWLWAEEGSPEDLLDGTLIRLLQSVVGSIPTPPRSEA